MKNFTAIFLLSFVLCACDEHYDTSQWKEDVSTFKPNKITSEDFEFFVREEMKLFVQNGPDISNETISFPKIVLRAESLTPSSYSKETDGLIYESLSSIPDQNGYYDHYEAREDTLCYFVRRVLQNNTVIVDKYYISKTEVAKEIARQKEK